jgi:hypothetical protein
MDELLRLEFLYWRGAPKERTEKRGCARQQRRRQIEKAQNDIDIISINFDVLERLETSASFLL